MIVIDHGLVDFLHGFLFACSCPCSLWQNARKGDFRKLSYRCTRGLQPDIRFFKPLSIMNLFLFGPYAPVSNFYKLKELRKFRPLPAVLGTFVVVLFFSFFFFFFCSTYCYCCHLLLPLVSLVLSGSRAQQYPHPQGFPIDLQTFHVV